MADTRPLTPLTVVSWRQGRLAPNWSFHLGLLILGWGVFNVVEGVIDHLVLEVHHVRDDLGGALSWDIGFVVFGVLLCVVGWLLYRYGKHALDIEAHQRTEADRVRRAVRP